MVDPSPSRLVRVNETAGTSNVPLSPEPLHHLNDPVEQCPATLSNQLSRILRKKK
jgi:hypothetical protein